MKQDITKVKLLGIFVGNPAPQFVARTLDDQEIKLSDLRGKIVLLDFLGDLVRLCAAELPNAARRTKSMPIRVSWLWNQPDRDAAAAPIPCQGKVPWPRSGPTAAQKHARENVLGERIPATFLIGPDGKVAAKDLRQEAAPSDSGFAEAKSDDRGSGHFEISRATSALTPGHWLIFLRWRR